MKGKFIQNISANTVQQIINQIFGLLIFYVLSTQFSKELFGQFNWCLAVLLTAFNILSFGIDQVIIRKIAEGKNTASLLSLYLFHVLLAGILFYAMIGIGYFIFPNSDIRFYLLLLIGLGKLLIFISTPFKQIVSGLEKFHWLALMSVSSNIIRGIALLVAAGMHMVSIQTVVLIFVSGDLIELLVCILLYKKKIGFHLQFSFLKKEYIALLKESMPQIGVVLFTSAMARFDWIFIGLILSAAKLAEYSFAYKVFEMATLPLIIIAPLLLPRFTGLLKQKKQIREFYPIIRIEMVIVFFSILLLNICWIPAIDLITKGKYGAVNSNTILLLSLCLPFLYLTNFLWSILFAKGQIKIIFWIFSITFCINLTGDIIFIPIFKNEGAAFAYLLALLLQLILYIYRIPDIDAKQMIKPLLISAITALISGCLFHYCFGNSLFLSLFGSLSLFLLLQWIMRQLTLSDLSEMNRIMSS